MRLPDTTHRVSQHTSDKVNRKIEEDTQRSISFYKNNPARIPNRLRQLDREWDIERALETNASTLIVITCLLGFSVSTAFFVIPLLVGAFLLQHALQGWCPPLPILRRMGFRTSSEIAAERKILEEIVEQSTLSSK
ncbi:MAG: hypothetical protein AAGC78_06510 [Cellvibrio sp.]|uniref:hypothetical protein n=1 Tax=Cellvibrio sp. TaxID=1965322 RepID=UPI0031A3EF20